jgi:hypothetical protein
MDWSDVRALHPNRWLVVEAFGAHTHANRRILDDLAVIEVCPDGGAALRRYLDLHHDRPERELYFVHTRNAELAIVERPWVGVRRNDAAYTPG